MVVLLNAWGLIISGGFLEGIHPIWLVFFGGLMGLQAPPALANGAGYLTPQELKRLVIRTKRFSLCAGSH